MKHLRSQCSLQSDELAVALCYDSQMVAPLVGAIGQSELARQIRSVALRYGVAIETDPALAAALSTLDAEEAIRPEHYSAVAKLLVRFGLV